MTMLTDSDLKELYEKAAALTDGRIEQALRFAGAQKEFPKHHPDADEIERVDAWIMALRMEQARRAGKLRMLSDDDGTVLARTWLQLSSYQNKLRGLGLNVMLRIDSIEHSHISVSMTISGPTSAFQQVVQEGATS